MITTVPAGGVRPPLNAPTTRKTLGKDEFLKLLVAQLENQDPTSPLQPHEFAAQLAQFSSVEQLTNLNAALLEQVKAGSAAQVLNQSTFASSLIGKQVVVEGDQVVVGAAGAATIPVDVQGAGTAQLTLKDASGRTVLTQPVGFLGPGRHQLPLPPGVGPGTYRYALDVTDGAGKAVPVTQYLSGLVDGVHFADGKVRLRIGSLTLPLDGVLEFGSAPAR